MDKVELFERVRILWPKRIEIEDSNALWRVYKCIEEFAPDDDHWLQLAAWAFHQALHAYADRVRSEDCLTISPENVFFEEFDRRMRFNLADESWEMERKLYEDDAHTD
ncbi:hypothetical protein [Sphingomonas sp. Leaf10]|uniref:hypothetical protein n=1 Tax=Sphingomonas sp. Leaf10 TaxID=1735676 RepID=UPI0012E0EB6B|nr:hypothetical protein [Sphingomonas sp. Leaf10]